MKLASMKSKLPRDLVELRDKYTLHDARLENVSCSFAKKQVEMVLMGWDLPLAKPVRYKLTFKDVTTFEQHLPRGRTSDSELSDVSHWQCDQAKVGTRVRVHFVSSAEIHIVFKGFRLGAQQAVPADVARPAARVVRRG